MSIPTAACCAMILQQQQDQAIQHQNQCRQDAVSLDKEEHKFCTAVENGRVVVKLIEPAVQT